MGRDPKEFLQKDDVVETEIEGIGTLRNRISG
jgi:2-keto-4-pentenoate hydratase/2-oxohepta-3-ene-1,7-dioic acid hydratase in catechol pathway